MNDQRITESASVHQGLEQQSTTELLEAIHREDSSVASAVQLALPAIQMLIESIVEKLRNGGRLFYIGAGTSGRMGMLDAAECPPTFGTEPDLVTAILAGGLPAMTKAVEGAEDDQVQGWLDLQAHRVAATDIVIGISASGTTPYVVEALKACKEHHIATGCISGNPGSALADWADFPVSVVTGPEFITGSTRMKSATAQKMVLNMISTVTMIRLGRVEGNQMVFMQLLNQKLIDRGVRMIMEKTGRTDYDNIRQRLLEKGSVNSFLATINS